MRDLYQNYIRIFIVFILACLALFLAFKVQADEIGSGFFDDAYILIVSNDCVQETGQSSSYYDATRTQCEFADSAHISFNFYGDEFALWSLRDTTGGDVSICVDANCATISAYSASPAFGEWIRYTGLSVDNHSVSITPLEAIFYFDALYIAPAPSGSPSVFTIEVVFPETTPETEAYQVFYEIGEDTITQTVAFDYRITAGDFVSVILDFSLLLFIVIFAVVWTIRYERSGK
jgi:hypothetical protein